MSKCGSTNNSVQIKQLNGSANLKFSEHNQGKEVETQDYAAENYNYDYQEGDLTIIEEDTVV